MPVHFVPLSWVLKAALYQVKAQLKLKLENLVKMQNPYDLVGKSFIFYFHWPCYDSFSALDTRGAAPHCVVFLLWHSLSQAVLEKTVENVSKWHHFPLTEVPCY